jgi:hypothetical protein
METKFNGQGNVSQQGFSMNFRKIGKFCLLLVIMGFFMPVGCNRNAFELAGKMEVINGVGIYATFILSIVGLIIGVLLLVKKQIPIIIDWLITIAVSGIVIIMFFYYGIDKGFKVFQSGAYTALIGSIAALIAQIVSAHKREDKMDITPIP